MASGMNPGLSKFASVAYGFAVGAALLAPAARLWLKNKNRALQKPFITMTIFVIGLFIVTLTPAGGFNPLRPFSKIRDSYALLVRPGDTASKTIQLPEWIDEYDKVTLRLFIGFAGKAGKNNRVGVFIDTHLMFVASGEKPMPLNWYEFPLPRELIYGKKQITVSLRKLPHTPAKTSADSPFVIGLKSGFRRGTNTFNGQKQDLYPYTRGIQKGSYKICLRLGKTNQSSKTILWWGSR